MDPTQRVYKNFKLLARNLTLAPVAKVGCTDGQLCGRVSSVTRRPGIPGFEKFCPSLTPLNPLTDRVTGRLGNLELYRPGCNHLDALFFHVAIIVGLTLVAYS
jgi:hypothetical protein